jgi:excisionase family DNA binding protein
VSRFFPQATQIGERLLVTAEIAELLAVPESWVREHSRTGKIPHVRLGRYVRYRKADVLAWLDEQNQGGAAWGKHKPVDSSGRKSRGSA